MIIHVVTSDEGTPGYHVEGLYSDKDRAEKVLSLLRNQEFPQYYGIMDLELDALHSLEIADQQKGHYDI